MSAKPIVIIGAGAAGLACARSYREHGGRAGLLMIGEEPVAPYRRPPLSKEFLRGELDARELEIEPLRWFAKNDVQLDLGKRASAIDPEGCTVTVSGDVLEAQAIVLATGAAPVRKGIEGIDHPAAITLRTLADSERLAEQATADRDVLVLGTGFIGCEVASSLAMGGANVTLLGQESLPQEQRLGHTAARRIASWLEDADVSLEMDADVSRIHDGPALERTDGSRILGDALVLAMGVLPRSELAQEARLALSDGAICTDSHMQVPGTDGRVFAIGDVAAAENATAGRRLRVEHWGEALEHGKVAGRRLAGADANWDSVPGFWSTIGEHTLKYAAWGDGYAQAHVDEHPGGGFTVWYSDQQDTLVGVLTHDCDADYELGQQLIARVKATT